MLLDNILCDVYVKSTPMTKAMLPDHSSSVNHMTVVGFSSPTPVLACSSHSDRTVKATTELPGVRFSSDAVENSPASKIPQAGISGQLTTGMSMELQGVTLSPSGQDGLANGSPYQGLKSAKHCLDFADSDSDMRSPKIARMCADVEEERNVSERSADNSVKISTPLARGEADCDSGRQHKHVVIHTSLPISVSESRSDPADVPIVTPVTQRSHKFLVCRHNVVCPSVKLCIVALRVSVEDYKFYCCVFNRQLPIHFFRHFWCRIYHLTTKHSENRTTKVSRFLFQHCRYYS